MTCKPCPKVKTRANDIYKGYAETGRIGNQRANTNHAQRQAQLIALREEQATGYASRINLTYR